MRAELIEIIPQVQLLVANRRGFPAIAGEAGSVEGRPGDSSRRLAVAEVLDVINGTDIGRPFKRSFYGRMHEKPASFSDMDFSVVSAGEAGQLVVGAHQRGRLYPFHPAVVISRYERAPEPIYSFVRKNHFSPSLLEEVRMHCPVDEVIVEGFLLMAAIDSRDPLVTPPGATRQHDLQRRFGPYLATFQP